MSDKLAAFVMLRPGEPSDLNFIYATWLRGLYYGDRAFRRIDKNIFMTEYHKKITRILDIPTCAVSVACMATDPEVIFGYSVCSVTENDEVIVHWVFVKQSWRGLKVGSSLVPDNVYAVTHMTDFIKCIKPDSYLYNPFLI